MKKTTTKQFPNKFVRVPLAAAILLLSPGLIAQQTAGIEEVIVTAQKRAQNLQDVPISIQSLGNETISELGIQNFQDYAKMLPSVCHDPFFGCRLKFYTGLYAGYRYSWRWAGHDFTAECGHVS